MPDMDKADHKKNQQTFNARFENIYQTAFFKSLYSHVFVSKDISF